MFTRLLYYYIVITDVYKFIVYRCLHVYVIAMYTDVYTFIVLLHCDYRCL